MAMGGKAMEMANQAPQISEALCVQEAEILAASHLFNTARDMNKKMKDVTPEDAARHYIRTGRPIHVRKVYSPENIYETGAAINLDPQTLSIDVRTLSLWQTYCKHHPDVEQFDMTRLPIVLNLMSQRGIVAH